MDRFDPCAVDTTEGEVAEAIAAGERALDDVNRLLADNDEVVTDARSYACDALHDLIIALKGGLGHLDVDPD